MELDVGARVRNLGGQRDDLVERAPTDRRLEARQKIGWRARKRAPHDQRVDWESAAPQLADHIQESLMPLAGLEPSN